MAGRAGLSAPPLEPALIFPEPNLAAQLAKGRCAVNDPKDSDSAHSARLKSAAPSGSRREMQGKAARPAILKF